MINLVVGGGGAGGVLQRDTGLLSIFRVVRNVTKGQRVPGDSFY